MTLEDFFEPGKTYVQDDDYHYELIYFTCTSVVTYPNAPDRQAAFGFIATQRYGTPHDGWHPGYIDGGNPNLPHWKEEENGPAT